VDLVVPRLEPARVPLTPRCPPEAQLLDANDNRGDHLWGHSPGQTPLYGYLRENGFLDPKNPPLKP
jgi:hypothetical protein